jgi:hypothetical protein
MIILDNMFNSGNSDAIFQTTEWGIMGLNEPVNSWLKVNRGVN